MSLQKGLLGLAVLTLATSSAHAAPPKSCQGQTISDSSGQLLCSRTFHASGVCDGQDRLADLKANGRPVTQMVDPWEPFPITIVGYRIVITDGSVKYALAGNSYTPDIMGTLAAPETAHGDFYPAGTGFAFPSIANASPHFHLDLHYGCLAPAPVQEVAAIEGRYERAWRWLRGVLGQAQAEVAVRSVNTGSFQGFYTVFYVEAQKSENPTIADAH